MKQQEQGVRDMVIAGPAIEDLIREALPEADVIVTELAGAGHHCGARIVSRAFAGKSRIQQHRMIYAALGGKLIDTFDALVLQTAVSH
ncbi:MULTISPECIES: BolA/IbaG family iron-sulfur metabolism protein [unclassified Bradyrhizobium]|uniref:BolA/IbaG family iron-sulfur metabolism protein n=1 Tax=unclassified Bradyrhizobium TaxID=2631580 RepID=UPI0020B1B504|nr:MULTISPECIES: BolA/IbaG family iron-sulfur metabolism protein [unclassified Bradyrhizobium]MCP3397025.1 BolA/IbaG family iron-sulfur metabolism protein [Bradyrhizobium sp. CCGB20]MCP3405537.1 BolA/IbaG family iron-sulfur metabolism protein [Bradyrhizobium sp. CCGB01]